MLTALKTDKELFGYRLPWYMGLCWREPDIRATRIAIIPLNFLLGWGYRFYFALLRGPRNRFIEQAQQREADEYGRGWMRGNEDGTRHGERMADILREAILGMRNKSDA